MFDRLYGFGQRRIYRGAKGPGPRVPHQSRPSTVFMFLAICETCACHVFIFR